MVKQYDFILNILRWVQINNMTKYDKMRKQFKSDGLDEHTIEKFIRQEMEMDEFRANEGIADINATREWQAIPANVQDIVLNNAFCHNCGLASFNPGYIIRKDKYSLIIEGTCSKCGERIVRVVD